MNETGDPLIVYINGKKKEINGPNPSTTLLQYLRNGLGLTGTKNACAQGGCGACTVMTSWWDKCQKIVRFKNINACITPLCYLHGCAITTVEGVGSGQNELHAIQENMVACHGVQCGYCSPGFVMSVYTLTQGDRKPTLDRLEQTLEGNLCRCTGYRPIIQSFKPFCQEFASSDIEDIYNDQNWELKCHRKKTSVSKPTLPPNLQALASTTVRFVLGDMFWIRPTTLEEVLQIMDDVSGARIVMGATAMGDIIRNRHVNGHVAGHVTGNTLICCSHVDEMNVCCYHDNLLEVGAAIDLAYLENYLESILAADETESCNTCFHALKKSLRWIASDQIKHTATIGGHLATCDPRSDLYPVLITLGATVEIATKAEQRQVLIDSNFVSGPWRTRLLESDVIVSMRIPIGALSQTFYYKQAKRKSFDYAIANACFAVTVADAKVTSARFCFGGIGRTFLLATKTARILIGKKLDHSTFKEAFDAFTQELQLVQTENVNRFKLQLAAGFFRKFWNQISYRTCEADAMADIRDWGISSGSQVWETPSSTQPQHDAVGKPIPNVSGRSLVTGEATFVADMPRYQSEIYVELVCSTRAHAKIVSLDVMKARQIPGFIGFMDSNWILGPNEWGITAQDDILFATSEVNYYGQPVGAVLAETEEAAKIASGLVEITYEDLPAILTLQDAIRKGSFLPFKSKPIEVGDPVKEFENCDFVREGVIQSGYQEHMYMEPIAAVVIPHENDELEVFVTTQSQKFCQKTLSKFLQIPVNRITVRTKRLGGAFGGKEYRVLSALGPAAIAAHRTRRPARCVLDRTKDMMITGKRHPLLTEYKVGFNQNGQLNTITLTIFIDAGYSFDVTTGVLNKVMLHVDGSYKIPNIRVEGHICRTNTPSNASFRGFGAPEGAYIIEVILAKLAETLQIPLRQIQSANMYREGDFTHYRQVLTNCNLERCVNECKIQSNFVQRNEEISQFNESHTWRKRGIAMMPCKVGVSNPVRAYNQGSALVNVYTDGSVLISHGGIEMGQGLHTKMIQVASRALGVPIHKVHICETGTNVIPNSISSAASFCSDIYGEAVIDACRTILERLEPLRKTNLQISWCDLLEQAFLERISLSATGYSRIGTNHRDYERGEGDPYHYFTYGAGCSVVEIDCLTGEHQVLSTDIVMDVGKSLNPGIDTGQIEGAFVQGYGWLTTEEILVEPDGKYNVSGPVDYKIPNIKGIPRDFKVSFLKDCPNERAVYSSKGIGEPPLVLSISVYLALRNAINSARMDAGLPPVTRLDIPLTVETIRMACP